MAADRSAAFPALPGLPVSRCGATARNGGPGLVFGIACATEAITTDNVSSAIGALPHAGECETRSGAKRCQAPDSGARSVVSGCRPAPPFSWSVRAFSSFPSAVFPPAAAFVLPPVGVPAGPKTIFWDPPECRAPFPTKFCPPPDDRLGPRFRFGVSPFLPVGPRVWLRPVRRFSARHGVRFVPGRRSGQAQN